MTRVDLRHGRVTLALHGLRTDGDHRPLLLLHGLGDRSPAVVPPWAEAWTGPVWALDFTGHGASTLPVGGGYTAEVLMADADTALAHLGPVTVIGRGLGAYIALLIAGARPHLVRGAVLWDGPGLAGGGTGPASTIVLRGLDITGATPDPWALAELGRDLRPTDYATSFARQATQLSGLEWPIAVCARWRVPWLDAVAAEPGVIDTTLAEALAHYATVG
jgi:pimeloyl-ACP methyl ester carboxylesterase